jgi:hypothetical protein
MDTATALVLATSIMALGAITFSALSLAFQRSHSRKSVRPFCNVNQRNTDTGMSVSLQNAGMGPMRIQKIVLLANEGDPIQAGIPLEEAISEGVKSVVLVHHLDAYVLAPLMEVELFRCALGIADDEETNLLRSKLGGKFLAIAYSDIYDDVYEKKEALNVK